jgi:hypothetical protein
MTSRQTNAKTVEQKDRQIDKGGYRQEDRLLDRQTDKRMSRQTEELKG